MGGPKPEKDFLKPESFVDQSAVVACGKQQHHAMISGASDFGLSDLEPAGTHRVPGLGPALAVSVGTRVPVLADGLPADGGWRVPVSAIRGCPTRDEL